MKTRIHLVRHGLSEANLDLALNRAKPDHAIALAEAGHDQAYQAGLELQRAILDANRHAPEAMRVRLLVSPYLRTRQTGDGLAKALDQNGIPFDRRENLQLREQSFGLFDGVPDDQLETEFPREYAHYEKHTRFEGEFFAPMPMGESRAMVADRVRGTFGTILRDMDPGRKPSVTDMVVVSHGVTIRCFRMSWLNRPWEWCEAEPNPGNCSITTLEGESGSGWIERLTFEGFHHRRTQQERREEGHVVAEAEQPSS